MTNKDDKGYNEITLSIALLAGIIAVLLRVIDYSNNQSLEMDYLSKPPLYVLMIFLLLELLIIFLFFIFKGISVHTADKCGKNRFIPISGDLFKISFVMAFMWIIASVMIVFFKLIYLPKDSHDPIIWRGYVLIFLITVAITGIIVSISEFETLNNIREKFKNPSAHSNFFFILIFLIIFFIIFVISSFSLVSQYLLTGSYSIEEFSQSFDNPDIIVFTMKEKGIGYDLIEVELTKINSSDINIPYEFRMNKSIDFLIIYRHTEKQSNCLWGGDYDMVWYLGVINISKLSPGTYLLSAQVKNNLTDNLTDNFPSGILNEFSSRIGISKRIAKKLFYIPPWRAKANYSFNCTRTS